MPPLRMYSTSFWVFSRAITSKVVRFAIFSRRGDRQAHARLDPSFHAGDRKGFMPGQAKSFHILAGQVLERVRCPSRPG